MDVKNCAFAIFYMYIGMYSGIGVNFSILNIKNAGYLGEETLVCQWDQDSCMHICHAYGGGFTII